MLQIDIDELQLDINSYKAKPMLIDYLKRRTNPLQIDIYTGSICSFDECLENTDVVIGIEM